MRYRRVRPVVSFTLATGFLFLLAAILTGVLHVELDLSVLDTNQQAVIIALIFSSIAAMLLYEW